MKRQITLTLLAAFLLIAACVVSAPTAPPPQAREALAVAQLEASPAPTPVRVCTVTADALNVRACGSISCPVLAWLRAGESVTQLAPPEAGWIQIKTQEEVTGWINSKHAICK